MISEQARSSLRRILEHAAQSRLRLHDGDAIAIAPLEIQGPRAPVGRGAGRLRRVMNGAAYRQRRVVALTISSMRFKLMVILQVEETEATRDYFLRGRADIGFQDVFLEIANLFCGAMNQELLRYFPDLGMSTPYILDAHCLSHLEVLNSHYLSTQMITLNDTVRISAHLCVSAYAPIDFHADDAAVEESNGELELF